MTDKPTTDKPTIESVCQVGLDDGRPVWELVRDAGERTVRELRALAEAIVVCRVDAERWNAAWNTPDGRRLARKLRGEERYRRRYARRGRRRS